jgi:hypothetical protein
MGLRLRLPASRSPSCWEFKQFGRFNAQRVCDFTHDLEARVKRSLLKLAQIASADFRFVGEIVLRQTFGMTQTAQIRSEDFPEVHPGSGAELLEIFTSIY